MPRNVGLRSWVPKVVAITWKTLKVLAVIGTVAGLIIGGYQCIKQERQKQFVDTGVVILRKGGEERKITVDGVSLSVSIGDFWEHGKEVSLLVGCLSQPFRQPITTRVMKRRDVEKVTFMGHTYAVKVLYVNEEEGVVRISIQNVERSGS